VNRSLARAKPGSCPDAKRGRTARTNGTLHSRLKITSSIRRQSHQQVRPEPGLHVRELRRERRTAQQRELPQPLPGVPVLQARRHCSRRPGLGLPRNDAPRAGRAPRRQGTRAGPPVRHLRLRPTQPGRRRHSARRRHRRDHRADGSGHLSRTPTITLTARSRSEVPCWPADRASSARRCSSRAVAGPGCSVTDRCSRITEAGPASRALPAGAGGLAGAGQAATGSCLFVLVTALDRQR
jgi:hypothetical protein